MLVVGLSGGIGSGKTVVSDHFNALGAPVIDTDVIARQIVEPGSPALEQLCREFGNEILLSDGALNRGALRNIAFSSKQNKAKLDAITHPTIRDEATAQVNSLDATYCILVVPLLNAESTFQSLMGRILIVTANREVKIERVMKRSNLSREEVVSIMSTQLDDSQRLSFADDVIENNTSLNHVYIEVEKLHQRYESLSPSS